MFAFAVWTQKQELFIARDRLGIKPLYYYAGEGNIVFASEVRAILATGLAPRQIDPAALNEYLAYQSIPSPRTLIKDVKAMAPGAWMTVDAFKVVKEHRYWDLLQNLSTEAHAASQSVYSTAQASYCAKRLNFIWSVTRHWESFCREGLIPARSWR